MNANAMQWALRQDVRNAPTKLMLVALASQAPAAGPALLRATRELYAYLAKTAAIRRNGIVRRLEQLVALKLVQLDHAAGTILLSTGKG